MDDHDGGVEMAELRDRRRDVEEEEEDADDEEDSTVPKLSQFTEQHVKD